MLCFVLLKLLRLGRVFVFLALSFPILFLPLNKVARIVAVRYVATGSTEYGCSPLQLG